MRWILPGGESLVAEKGYICGATIPHNYTLRGITMQVYSICISRDVYLDACPSSHLELSLLFNLSYSFRSVTNFVVHLTQSYGKNLQAEKARVDLF
jgi:hypothetical protein